MGSLGMWLGSSAVMAGVGAAMLCGAGSAAADTGDDSGPTNPSTHATATSRGAEKQGVRQNPAEGVRRPSVTAALASSRSASQAAATIPFTRVVTQAAEVAAPLTKVVTQAAAVTAPARGVGAPTKRGGSRTSVLNWSNLPAPSPDPVDPAQFAGTYYEQGSVKQFFSIGLVNTKAVYSLNPDGTIRVQNSGNYFFNNGPRSSIVGSAVPVNSTNTALSVSFLPFNPGIPNYTIVAHAPDYSWVIVSDPIGYSGYILTRSKTIAPQDYEQLVYEARSRGVWGPITKTKQFAA